MIENASENAGGKPESGGILLGSIRGPHLEIVDFTETGPADRGTFSEFVRQDKLHQRKADNAWRLSDGTVTFIGEWHSHPMGRPIPSSVDKANWCQLTKTRKHPMFFFIASPSSWSGYLVTRTLTRNRIRSFTRVEYGDVGIVLS